MYQRYQKSPHKKRLKDGTGITDNQLICGKCNDYFMIVYIQQYPNPSLKKCVWESDEGAIL